MPCADHRWEELPYTNKLNTLGLSDKELKKKSYQERCNLLNNNPVFLAWDFHHNVEVSFKEIKPNAPLRKAKHYSVHSEF